MTVAAIADRHVFSPYGLFGGHPSRPNQFRVRRGPDGRWRTFQQSFGLSVPSKFSGLTLAGGDAWDNVNHGRWWLWRSASVLPTSYWRTFRRGS